MLTLGYFRALGSMITGHSDKEILLIVKVKQKYVLFYFGNSPKVLCLNLVRYPGVNFI